MPAAGKALISTNPLGWTPGISAYGIRLVPRALRDRRARLARGILAHLGPSRDVRRCSRRDARPGRGARVRLGLAARRLADRSGRARGLASPPRVVALVSRPSARLHGPGC